MTGVQLESFQWASAGVTRPVVALAPRWGRASAQLGSVPPADSQTPCQHFSLTSPWKGSAGTLRSRWPDILNKLCVCSWHAAQRPLTR